MQTLRFALIILIVTVTAGATILLAWHSAGFSLPVWQAALGPLLLVTMLLVRLKTMRIKKSTE
jgi:hypothetical protein